MSQGTPRIDLEHLLAQVTGIAETAGGRIMEIYESDFVSTVKEDRSPLTAADLAAHECIVHGLGELLPELPVLSEESASSPFSARRGWTRFWLVDPLDGTKEFIKKNGEFTVNIALVDRHEPVLGVVYVPAQRLCYSGARGLGAFKKPGHAEPARIRARHTVRGKFTVAGSRSHGSDQQLRFFNALGPETHIISIGSALKFCLVAEGSVDIYPRFGPTSEWDTAAAQCIVEEAGGRVIDLEFRPLRYNTRASVLNPPFLVLADPGFDWQPYLAGLT